MPPGASAAKSAAGALLTLAKPGHSKATPSYLFLHLVQVRRLGLDALKELLHDELEGRLDHKGLPDGFEELLLLAFLPSYPYFYTCIRPHFARELALRDAQL